MRAQPSLEAVAACGATGGLHEMVLRIFIQFLCYLRPGECSNLLVKQLIAPLMTGVLSCAYTGWVILLHPAEDKSPGKTGLFDATVMLDSDAWLHPILQALVMKRDPSEPLWRHTHREVHETFQSVVEELQLEGMGWNLYNLRHGGATHDVITRRRSLLEVKQRGRWSADASLKRYVKQARLQTELARIPQNIREYGMGIITALPTLLGKASTRPPSLPGTATSQPGSKRKAVLARNSPKA